MSDLVPLPTEGDPDDWTVRRLWTYRRGEWDPPLRERLGFPYFGCDEWGRRTIVIGLWFVGYVVVAWRTCWCQDCHEVREQTYRFAAEEAGRD